MARTGIEFAIDERKCGNCVSYNDKTGKCDSIDTQWTLVFKHNYCKFFIDKETFIKEFRTINNIKD